MPSFLLKGRKTTPVYEVTVEAETREEAIAQAVAEAEEGEQIEVMSATEIPEENGGDGGGATGATGAKSASTTRSRTAAGPTGR